jgi:hypothetical protein
MLDERYQVYLDSYLPLGAGAAAGAYSDEAVVYDETDRRVYPKNQAAIPGHTMWIGYPYTSRIRSMPVLANDRMKQNIIKTLLVRFHDSFMPHVKSIPNGIENKVVAPGAEPYSGVIQVPFPGGYDRDVFFEILHEAPTRCRVLAINAEAN